MKLVRLLFFSMMFCIFCTPLIAEINPFYAVIRIQGTINPVIAEHVVNSIEKATSEGANFIVILLDTPGGLMSSMQDIIKGIMESKIPVIVYTSPRGAQAASAGGYIMLSAHISAMAPGTRIGAMSPMNIFDMFASKEKGTNEVLQRKITNDAIAYARSLAQQRGRNVAWAERAVRDAISSTNIEALREGVIDIIAQDINDLLRQIHNRRVLINGRTHIITSVSSTPREYPMNWQQRMLNFFSDPQVIFILLIIAIVGIGMEFKNPGMIVPGVVGAISFIIFLMAVRVLPVNFLGVLLIVLSVILFILELKITSYGIFTIMGIISFAVGSMILFDNPLPGFSIPWTTIVGVGVCVLLFVFVLIRLAILAHQSKVVTGHEGMIGETGTVLRTSGKRAQVQVHGEIWNAKSEDELHQGDKVTVEKIEGMTLFVRKID
ncbi:MAG: nodulation protein NfeD [Spirochaetes bacterium]|nr:nodulation protein NfeD [Spirochaetota bacterium]